MKVLKSFQIIFVLFVAVSCATYQNKVNEPRQQLKNGQFTAAIETFERLANEESRDQLVYQMDYATSLQIAGRFEESSRAFIKADKLVDLNDYHSVSNVVGATLGGEEMIQYKGESFEKFFINTFNAINFLMLGRLDDSLVEARRINEKINKMRLEGRKPYEQSPFARYLAAVLWEAQKNYDSAYIEYEATYNLDPQNPFIAQDLLRSARLARRPEALKKWKEAFGDLKESPDSLVKENGELIIVFQQGWGPEKQARQQYRYPELYPVFSRTRSSQIEINNQTLKTEIVYNVSKVAIETLREDYAALVARRVGGVAAKAVVADQFRQKNELLGSVAWIAMNLSDRADLRQWSTLPETVQMARIFLKPGTYNLKMFGTDSFGQRTHEEKQFDGVQIKANQKTFLSWRSLQ
jgi:hypothetical protein